MPRKGGGGQGPSTETESTERPFTTDLGGPIPGSMDLSVDDDEDDDTFVYGDIVHDEKDPDPKDLVVVNLPDVRADRWEVDGETLAKRNPDCPPGDEVVVVVPLLELNEYIPDWDTREEEIPLSQLEEDDVTVYAFPEMRLDRVSDSHLR